MRGLNALGGFKCFKYCRPSYKRETSSPMVSYNLDPYKFSYRKNKSTEDATLLYNNLVVEHLENKNACQVNVY